MADPPDRARPPLWGPQACSPGGDWPDLLVDRDDDDDDLDGDRAAAILSRGPKRPPAVTEDPTPSEKLVAGDFEAAAALALQKLDVSSSEELHDATPSEELVTGTPQTVTHDTIDCSLSSVAVRHEKPVADAANSASAQTLQEPDVSSLGEVPDTRERFAQFALPFSGHPVINVFHDVDGKYYTDHPLLPGPFDKPKHVCRRICDLQYGRIQLPVVTEDRLQPPQRSENLLTDVSESSSTESLQEPDVSSSKELLDSTSSEKPINSSPQTVLGNTTDGSPPPSSSLLSMDTSSSGEPITVSPKTMPDSVILNRSPQNFYQEFYIRMNRWGSFSMYPDLGGPFESVDVADDAINCYLDELRCRASKELDKLSHVDRMIHEYKYYLDGTPKRGPNSPSVDNNRYLVQALLDEYNEDHNLFGNQAHELEVLVGQQWFCEDHAWYYHFNFRTKQKETDDFYHGNSNLFFAEVLQGRHTWEVKCCCMIKFNDSGHCYGCTNNESPGMKHPNDIGAYTGGHSDGYLPFGLESSSSDDDEALEEARLRNRFEGLGDPNFWERIRSLTQRRSKGP